VECSGTKRLLISVLSCVKCPGACWGKKGQGFCRKLTVVGTQLTKVVLDLPVVCQLMFDF